ncbi:MAG TPA: WG repeat-containing protein [Pyrinomonadaceae bacterium]
MFNSGQKVGLYTLIEKLGRGGFGEVWLAEKRSEFVTKKVAVKLPHPGQVNFDAIRQEATLWEQASGHPNVLPIIDADVFDGQVVIVSEYADGGSLADRLQREGKLSLKDAVEMTIGILHGLEFLHSRRIIHRDIKPQNILLQGKTPRLADFGISRAMQATMVSSAIIGTDAYMSPEAFDGKRNAQTDIWSVGVVLYQLLKGSLPFPQDHPSERMFAVLTKEFEPLPDEILSDLRQIVRKALAKQPEQRYLSAEDMREDLQKALIGIAHPTLAKTEILIKPDLAGYDANTPTIAKSEPPPIVKPGVFPDAPQTEDKYRTVVDEVQTIVGKRDENQPAPAAYQQSSVVTQLKQTPAATNQPVQPANPASSSFNASKRKRNLTVVFIGVGAIFIIAAALSLGLAVKYLSKPAYPPGVQKRIDEAKKKDPYYVYNDRISFEDNKKYGFKDSKGKIVIPAKYDTAGSFSNGLAPVQSGDKWGYIDENGNVVIPFKFNEADYFSQNLAAVKQNDKYGFIDTSGNEITPFKYERTSYSFDEGMCSVELNGKWGFIDRSGKEVIPFRYDMTKFFSESLVAVAQDGKWGFIDKNGSTVIPFKYDEAVYFNEGLASVKLNDKYGFIDKTDNEVIAFIYDNSGLFPAFEDGFARVCMESINTGSCGIIDKTGREVVPYKYDYVYGFSEDLAAAEKDNKWGFVNKKGVEVIPLKYDSGGFFDDNYAEVTLNGRKLRIDKNGSETDIGATNSNTNMR